MYEFLQPVVVSNALLESRSHVSKLDRKCSPELPAIDSISKSSFNNKWEYLLTQIFSFSFDTNT